MEGYTRHSRSHYRAAPPPPASASSYKKGFSNGAGDNGFTAYDDIFGGPPKFGATPFAPRAEDYSEIFGSFRSSRSSSIPMLDLPPVDDSVAAFEVRGCTGLEYSDIFGGFDFADFAASYHDLFRRSDATEESSDDAWTQVGTESPSGESDPYASSGRNKYFLNGDIHETLEDKVFDLSYRSFLGTTEDVELTHEAQLNSFPGYTYEVEGSDLRKENEEIYSSGVADDIILCEDSSGYISVEKPWKTASIQSHNSVGKESNEYSDKAGGVDGISLSPRFVFSSDVSPRAESSHLPPVSGLPPAIVDRKKVPASSTSDYKKSKSNTIETICGGGSFDFFDVECNASSSSIASAGAIKEAMERAKVKINSAKELRKGKKDSVKDMPFSNNDSNSDGKVTVVFDETIMNVDELHLTNEKETNLEKTSGDGMQFSSKASQVWPDSMQSEDAVNMAAETAKNQSSSTDPVVTESGNIKEPAQEMINCHFGNGNAKTMHVKKLEQNVVGIDTSIKEHEDSESADESCNPRENRRRLRTTKSASRNAFHQKMVKLAQDVHETVNSGQVETVKSGEVRFEADGANKNPEIHFVEEKNERRFEQATDQVYYDGKYNEDSYLAGSELSSEEDFVQADFDKKAKEDCRLKENGKRETEVAVNGSEPNDAHQDEENEELCVQKGAEAMKRVLSPRDENLSVLNEDFEQKQGKGKSGRNEKEESDVRLKEAHEENNERDDKVCGNGACRTDKCEENAAMPDFCEKKLKKSVDSQNFEIHSLATGNTWEGTINAANDHSTISTCSIEDGVDFYEKEIEEPVQTNELKESQMDECWAINEDQKRKSTDNLQPELKMTDQDSNQERNVHIESEYFAFVGKSTLDEVVPEMAQEHKEPDSSNLSSSPDEKMSRSSDVSCEREEKLENHVAVKDTPIIEEKADFRSRTSYGEVEPKVADTQKAEASQPIMSERKESVQKQYLSSNMNQRVGKETKAVNGDLTAEDREIAEKLKRKEESDRERLRELQLEKEREKERELEAKRLNELEKLRLKRLEELRDREREKDLETERLRKVEEEWEREREREKDRMGIELKMSASRERTERAAVERATAEARQRVMADARERLEKACAEAREKSLGKTSKESQLRAERAAVDRATAEARERAFEKVMAERATFETRDRVERSVSEKFSSSFRDVGLRQCSSSNDLWNSDKSDGVEGGESSQRCRARLERHRRTVDRVAKALAEKNMRDLIAQREQAERNRFAETLDADIKRWSNGKEGNLRALLSTLQYMLGADSGWQSIPLTDVITSVGVKKAYRKATLCVHPDKLQQRGATIQQKYICEKVFDLLKDAWNRFNSEER